MDKNTLVYILDDDESILQMLDIGLSNAGYRVKTALTESQLRQLLSAEKPDVILLDISIPGIDGISLCRNLRLDEKTKDVPIIMVTAFNDRRTYDDALLFGASDYIAKPFVVSDVVNKIEQVRARYRRTRD